MTKTLAVIAGPTASGKTRAGIEIASRFQTEIISADSRQVYRETRIGTAVPSPEEMKMVTHHFIQSISLETYYNASMYEKDVLRRLQDLFKTHNLVLMVGGSGLYINAVCEGIDEFPSINPKIRKKLAEIYAREGLEYLQQMLKERDPASYAQVDLNNHFRVLKALEVTVQTGIPYSAFLKRCPRKRPFNIIRLALNDEREILYERINNRVLDMVDEGLVDEVKGLQKFREKNAMKTVGYREMFRHLDGIISLEEAIDLVQRNTRKYARKQITWFRKNNLYTWFKPEDFEGMADFIEAGMSN